ALLLAQRLVEAVVVEAAPREPFARRQLVAEAVEPATDELVVDAVPVHPGAPIGEIGELGRDRPRRLAARELHAHAFFVPEELHAGKFRAGEVEAIVEQLRDVVRVDVDDEVFHVRFPLWIAFQIARCDIGRVSIAAPRGPSASLTALAIAAGAPR